jgi:DNA-binding transcriptional MerR regulator
MTPSELCQRTRITQRELQWWTATGVIASTSTARGRDFDEAQALTAAIVADLRRKGVTLHRIRSLRIREPQAEYLVLASTTDGVTSAVWCGEQILLERVAACPGPCLVVSVEDLRKRLYDQTTSRCSPRPRN